VEVPVEWQWYIRKMAHEYNFAEKIIFGLILTESTFHADAGTSCKGLAQISSYWLRRKPIEPYRITEDYKERDLYDPYDNIDTLIEIWSYAVDVYDIDLTTE